MAGLLLAATFARQDLPELRLVLTPHATAGVVDYLDVSLSIGRPGLDSGATLLHMPLVVASIPTPRYDGDAVQARDAAGPLPLTQADDPPMMSLVFRRWIAARATSGDVVVTFRAPMRAVSADTRPGPLFDLRAEAEGLNGAGLAFLALPDVDARYHITVHWDLSGLPAGSLGVWSLGEGDVSTTGRADLLGNTYYAAGPMHVSGPMYWFGTPPFDATLVAGNIARFFGFVSRFFQDSGGSYRVFVRKNPYRSGGGTTLVRSFMFGYSDAVVPTPDELHALVAHEMVHNWPAMEGEDESSTSWYSEGAADYYSMLLSWRAGVYDTRHFLAEINRHASAYYTNPLQRLSNDAAAERYWSDSRAQRVPYGRGFLYLTRIDAAMRVRSHGKRNLDDLVLAMLRRRRHGQAYDLSEWLELVTRELGHGAKAELDSMAAGATLPMAPGSFGPCFRAEPFQERIFELGFEHTSLEGSDRHI
ncbi:MAG TPA: hypothetical protein VGP87_00230, partial [Gemmatimonadales bacterium]|nr:hypothetical protein [Gemmatimonadales bacterium]